MLWFTSDLHLGYEPYVERGFRPFVSIEEHDARLIGAINERVGENDELWILGDLMTGTTPDEARAYRKRIACKHVHLIRGNHDRSIPLDHAGAFESVRDYVEIGAFSYEGYRLILSHYPLLDWNYLNYGSVQLHGHIHSGISHGVERALGFELPNRTSKTAYNDWCRNQGKRRFDVGVDANKYAPVSLEYILDFFGILSSEMA